MKNKKKTIIIIVLLAIILIGIVVHLDIINMLHDDKDPLLRKLQSATDPGEYGYSFNQEGALKYTDLSLDLRKNITRKQFKSIETYLDAQKNFNAASKDIKHLPKDSFVIDQPVLCGAIWIDNKRYRVTQAPVIGHRWYIKHVVIYWHMDIEPYDD